MKKGNRLIIILFIIYLVILTWIILFKMQFSLDKLPVLRGINLIPFNRLIEHKRIDLNEMINNMIVFIPVGLYLSIILKERNIFNKILFVIILTFSYELLQFILGIGITDITDIIMNTFGGIIGISAINMLYKVFKNHDRLIKILTILALIITIFIILFLSLLILVNL